MRRRLAPLALVRLVDSGYVACTETAGQRTVVHGARRAVAADAWNVCRRRAIGVRDRMDETR